jgi:hypothetical protein
MAKTNVVELRKILLQSESVRDVEIALSVNGITVSFNENIGSFDAAKNHFERQQDLVEPKTYHDMSDKSDGIIILVEFDSELSMSGD